MEGRLEVIAGAGLGDDIISLGIPGGAEFKCWVVREREYCRVF